MKRAIKKLWVEALENGKYKQGTGSLRVENEFCCLGVLCDLYRKEKGVKWKKEYDNQWNFFDEKNFLPFEVQKWAGLDSDNPCVVGGNGYTNSLSNLNDDGHDFKEIAKAIRKNL